MGAELGVMISARTIQWLIMELRFFGADGFKLSDAQEGGN